VVIRGRARAARPAAASQGVACCDVVNRGAAYSDGKVFFNTLDDNTIALDAETGKVIWKTKLGDINTGESITMAPLVVKVPAGLTDEQVLFLSDIFPTGYMAAENCHIRRGDVVAVYGCGPVGQFAIKSATLLGAAGGVVTPSPRRASDAPQGARPPAVRCPRSVNSTIGEVSSPTCGSAKVVPPS